MSTGYASGIVAEIDAAKKEWSAAKAAGDQAGMAAAHQKAEAARAKAGFSGGGDGSQMIILDPAKANLSGPGAVQQLQQMNETPPIAPAQVPASAPVTTSTPAVRDLTSEIERLYAAQRAARLSSLQKARDMALSGLSAEEGKLAPAYYNSRNQVAGQNAVQARNLAEYMASKGSGSGAQLQARVAQEGILQGQLGTLSAQEQAARDEINRRMSDVTSGYANDSYTAENEVAAAQALAQIQEAQRVDALQLAQFNTDRTFNRGVYESDRSYGMQKEQQEAALAATAFEMKLKQEAAALASDPNSPANQMLKLQLESAQFELSQARALAAYAPAEAAARIAQIQASTNAALASAASSRASVGNQATDNARQADNAAYDRFLSMWQSLGYAPANSYGVAQGTPYAPGVKASSSNTPKNADLLSLRNEFNQAILGVDQPVYDSNGKKVGTTQIQKMTAETALSQIQLMEQTGQLTEAEAEQLAISIPAVNALLQAIKNRENNQSRY